MNKIILSQRESEVLQLIAYEHTNQQIADSLHISYHTVDSHRKSMQYKLRVKNTAGLIRRAFELGFLRIDALQLYHDIPNVLTSNLEHKIALPSCTS